MSPTKPTRRGKARSRAPAKEDKVGDKVGDKVRDKTAVKGNPKPRKPRRYFGFIDVLEAAKADPRQWYVAREYNARTAAATTVWRFKGCPERMLCPEGTGFEDYTWLAQSDSASDTSVLYVAYGDPEEG